MAAPKKLLPVLVIALLLAGGAAYYLIMHRGLESTDDAAIEGHVVGISPRVGGYVKTVHVEDNQNVKAGDVLVEIDAADYALKRDAAAAALAAAEARLLASGSSLASTRVSAPSGLAAAEAQLRAAKAEWDKARADLQRMRGLNDLARTRAMLDSAIAAEASAHSSFNDAEARLRTAGNAPQTVAAAEANVSELEALVRQAAAALAQAEKDLTDTKIAAPFDGRAARRGVEPGAYVQPGQQLFWLIGKDMWVTANFKETQLTHMRPGQKARISVDAFPDAALEGTVDSLQYGTGARFSAFPPENATGNFVKIVQRVPVKIRLDTQADLPLGPGMSVVPVVDTNATSAAPTPAR